MDAVNEQIGANARRDPRAWARKILDRYYAGQTVHPIALSMAKDAIEPSQWRKYEQREPGSDDE